MRNLVTRLLVPALLLGALLTACGGGSDSASKPYDPAATAQALLDSTAFSQPLDAMSLDLVCGPLYNIDANNVTDSAVYTSLTAGAEEIAVLTLKDEDTAKQAMEALRDRVSEQTEALKDYQPEEVGKLDKAILDQKGNSVLLVVANDADAAQKVLKSLDS
ncbi:MAG TPA: DUF4358 domain-containing protein [Candidatus Flavonifractor merdigallinarum]|uniref:DUF4358 domain-containing protein n=1 Tax=Candidatus Flavonifractor merdigallinarum TaxID=2838589 RepID=A0A9D1Y8T8_9FIRM|nr:DUF4358 domain-containing protein [Candidatus Flavonifractor merdigallinarum]